MRIGDLLIQSGFLTDDQLESALIKQKLANKTPIGQLLIMFNFLEEGDLDLVLQAQRKILFTSLDSGLAVRALRYARQHHINFAEATQQVLSQLQGSIPAGQTPASLSQSQAAQTVLQAQKFSSAHVQNTNTAPDTNTAPAQKPNNAAHEQNTAAHKQNTAGLSQSINPVPNNHAAKADELILLSQTAASRENWTEALSLLERACKLEEEQQSSAEKILPTYCTLLEFYLRASQKVKLPNCLARIKRLVDTNSTKLSASTFVFLAGAATNCLNARMLKDAQEIYSAILPRWTELLPYESGKYAECLRNALLCRSRQIPFERSNLKIGELLKLSGLIDADQFQEALQQSKKQRLPLGRVLVQSELIEMRELRNAAKVQVMCRSSMLPGDLAGMVLKAACNTQLSGAEFFYRIQLEQDSADLKTKQTAELIAKMDELILSEENKGTQAPESAVLAAQVADLCLQRGEMDEAELMFRRAHAVFAVSGEGCQDKLADQCKKIGRLLIGQKKYPEAELLLLQSLEIKSRLLGEMHPDLSDILIDVGYLYYCQASYAAAIGFLRSAWILQQEQSSADSKRHVLHLLIKCFDQSGQGSEASIYREQLKAIDDGAA